MHTRKKNNIADTVRGKIAQYPYDVREPVSKVGNIMSSFYLMSCTRQNQLDIGLNRHSGIQNFSPEQKNAGLCQLSPVLDLFRHRQFFSFPDRTDRMPDSPTFRHFYIQYVYIIHMLIHIRTYTFRICMFVCIHKHILIHVSICTVNVYVYVYTQVVIVNSKFNQLIVKMLTPN